MLSATVHLVAQKMSQLTNSENPITKKVDSTLNSLFERPIKEVNIYKI